MPTYAHACAEHGEFDDMRPIARHAEDAECPVCAKPCGRIVTVPRFRSMERNSLIAHERNEKSRHEPHVCSSGCSHNHGSKKIPSSKPPALEQYKGPRPWVIEHGCT